MDSRQQFEEWVVGRKVVKKHGAQLKTTSDGTYCDYRINDRWLAWEASRKSIVVNLPRESMLNGTMDGKEVRAKINEAGIRTK